MQTSKGKTRAAWQLPLLFVVATALTGCGTTGKVRKEATSVVEEQPGFTIAETQRIASHRRADYNAGIAALARGDHDAGIALLEALVEAEPALAVPRIDLGIAYHQTGDLAAAESQLSAALLSSPSHPVALNELGIIYRKTGRFAQARQSYEKALASYPDYHFARRNLAVLCDLYLGDLGCALEHYEIYAAGLPGDSETAMWIADLRMRMGHEDQK